MSCCRSVWVLCASCIWVSVSFYRFGKLSAVNFFKYVFDPFLSPPSGNPLMLILAHFILSHRSCMSFSLFHLPFWLLFWLRWFPLFYLPISLVWPSVSFSLVFIVSRVLFMSGIESSIFDWVFFIVTKLFFKMICA